MVKRRPAPNSAAVVEAKRAGASISKICADLDCSQASVRKILELAGLVKKQGAYWCERPEPTRSDMEKWCRGHLADLHREHGPRTELMSTVIEKGAA